MSTIDPILRVGPTSAGLLMTPEEFDAITDYDDLYQYELVRGVLVVTPLAAEPERRPNELLGHLLQTYQESHPQGAMLDSTVYEQYIRTSNGRRRADRVIWAGLGRCPDPEVDVPTIAIEFPSAGKAASRRDHVEKRREYIDAGVREYWMIDRFRRVMMIYRQEGSGSSESQIGEGEVYRTPMLPGFELPLARLLAAADEWKDRVTSVNFNT
jgi:Uma2 family endonuclease